MVMLLMSQNVAQLIFLVNCPIAHHWQPALIFFLRYTKPGYFVNSLSAIFQSITFQTHPKFRYELVCHPPVCHFQVPKILLQLVLNFQSPLFLATLFVILSWSHLQCFDAVGCDGRKGIWPVKKLSGGVLAWLVPLTVSCFSKIQIGFTFLVPAHPGSPGQRAVKRVCVVHHFQVMHFQMPWILCNGATNARMSLKPKQQKFVATGYFSLVRQTFFTIIFGNIASCPLACYAWGQTFPLVKPMVLVIYVHNNILNITRDTAQHYTSN